MKTFLAQNQFISNSTSHVPVDVGSAAADDQPPLQAAADAIHSSDDGVENRATSDNVKRQERVAGLETRSATIQRQVSPAGSSETEGAVSVSAASSDISDIPEIFHWVRKLIKQSPRYVLNEGEFMADVEEEPLFLRDGDHLRRWSA